MKLGAADAAQLAKCLPIRHWVHTCNPSIWEVEAKGPQFQCYPQLHGEWEASLGYTRLGGSTHTHTQNKNK